MEGEGILELRDQNIDKDETFSNLYVDGIHVPAHALNRSKLLWDVQSTLRPGLAKLDVSAEAFRKWVNFDMAAPNQCTPTDLAELLQVRDATSLYILDTSDTGSLLLQPNAARQHTPMASQYRATQPTTRHQASSVLGAILMQLALGIAHLLSLRYPHHGAKRPALSCSCSAYTLQQAGQAQRL